MSRMEDFLFPGMRVYWIKYVPFSYFCFKEVKNDMPVIMSGRIKYIITHDAIGKEPPVIEYEVHFSKKAGSPQVLLGADLFTTFESAKQYCINVINKSIRETSDGIIQCTNMLKLNQMYLDKVKQLERMLNSPYSALNKIRIFTL